MDINKYTCIDWSTFRIVQLKIMKLTRYRLLPYDLVIARMADTGKVGLIVRPIDAIAASYLSDYGRSARTTLYSYFICLEAERTRTTFLAPRRGRPENQQRSLF